MPLSFCVTGVLVGWWLTGRPRHARKGRALILASVFALMLFSNKWVSTALFRPLETQYRPIPELVAGAPLLPELAACHYVAVLGGGNGFSPGFSANNLLWGPALARLTEGLRLLRALPDAKLIVSGGAPGDRETHAKVMGRAAQAFGIAADRILYLEDVKDTEDESRSITRVAEGKGVAVVTSAWHMPRTMALFRSAGGKALACPTEFLTHEGGPIGYEDFLWNIQALGVSSLAIRERVGYLWVWARGKAA